MPDEDYGQFIKNVWETNAHPFNFLWEWAKEPDEPKRRAERWQALADWAIRHAKASQGDDAKDWRKKARVYKKRAAANTQQPHEDVPGIESGGWHPDAHRVGVVGGIGPLQHPVCGVLHTTEGSSLPAYSGSNPHFTIDPLHNVVYQHQSVYQGARALENDAGGVETNRKAIQIEIIGYAGQSQNWSDETYDHIADLMRWIESHCGVKRTFGNNTFPGGGHTDHMTYSEWNAYDGWCGHCNAPENIHWDPGAIRKAELV